MTVIFQEDIETSYRIIRDKTVKRRYKIKELPETSKYYKMAKDLDTLMG